MRKLLHALCAAGITVPLCVAAWPAGAAGALSTFTIVELSPSQVAPGQPFVVSGLECVDQAGHPHVQRPTGTMVFTDATTGVALGTAALVPHSSINCGIATVTDAESLRAGFYEIKAQYVPGGSLPVPTNPAGNNFEQVAGSNATARCATGQTCNATAAASASAAAPGLTVMVTGKSTIANGAVRLRIAPGSLPCPNLTPTVAAIADLTDNLTPSTRLTVTATLPLTSSTVAEQVCFNSDVPFKSQSNPTVKKAGTAFLLNCAQVANVAPCVQSSKQIDGNVVVTFVVPGGDPRFYIVQPKGRQLWLSHITSGKVGMAYSAQFQTRGGIAPFHWTIASGHLPNGVALIARSGTIVGKPTVKGNFPVVVQASDAEKPPKTAKLSIPLSVT